MMRLVLALALLAGVVAATPTEVSADTLPAPAVGGIYPMVYPLAGEAHYTDTFGAPRSGGRTHEGTDLMADKMVPVLAAASGTISWVSSSCCALKIDHDDGWASMYIHLNNDTPGTDDGLGNGIVPGLERGSHVEAGQLIGWVGDSGNAEWTAPHLHFELHAPGIGPISPYQHLLVAQEGGTGLDVAAYVDAGSAFHQPLVLGGSPLNRFYFGIPGDAPLMGDWNCDGTNTPAMYRSSNGFVYLTNSNEQGFAESDFYYGIPGDVPIAGDWDGDGCDTFAIYRPSERKVYVRNELGTGIADYSYSWGAMNGDLPFAGDFDGDGIDTVGFYRPWNALVYYRNSHTSGTTADNQFFFGAPGDKIVAGDWDGDGDDTVAVYRQSSRYLIVNLDNNYGPIDHSIWVGNFENIVVSNGL
ncbi:MAG: M23 family metallopeptidase [Acidimicrobiia bacterium]|nr:M23 family metallopeptidase [Acidimicrobiia bacterium]